MRIFILFKIIFITPDQHEDIKERIIAAHTMEDVQPIFVQPKDTGNVSVYQYVIDRRRLCNSFETAGIKWSFNFSVDFTRVQLTLKDAPSNKLIHVSFYSESLYNGDDDHILTQKNKLEWFDPFNTDLENFPMMKLSFFKSGKTFHFVRINFTIMEKNVPKPKLEDVPPSSEPTINSVTVTHFGDLLKDEQFKDVTLSLNDKEIKAHKSVLALGSPILRDMFQLEKQLNRFTIEDIEGQVFHEIINFIYTKNFSKETDVIKLMIAADKLKIPDLINLCESKAATLLSEDNVINFLVTANRISATKLEQEALKFIQKNLNKLVGTKEFNAMLSENCQLVKKIFEKMAGV